MIPNKAFILAAGMGTRMRPFTDSMPKPLAEVAGRSLLERTLDQLEDAGVTDVVINTHHLAHKITQRLQGRTTPKITFSHEPELLETGGGIKKMLHFFGQDPFYVLSGDGLFTGRALENLAAAWDGDKMDILVLLQPLSTFELTEGVGDFDLMPGGRPPCSKIIRSPDKKGAYMFTSIRLNHPRVFKGSSEGKFSYLEQLDAAQKAGRLYGLVHDADWHHLSTMADIEAVNKAFK